MSKATPKRPFESYRKQNAGTNKTFRRPIAGGYLIFFMTFPLVFVIIKSLTQGKVFSAIVSTLCLGMFYFGGSSIRKGLHNQVISKQRKWHRSSSFPWKVTGAVAVACATAITSLFLSDQSLFTAVGFGLTTFAGCLMVYGTDPRFSEPDAVSTFGVTTDEIVSALEEAEKKIQSIETASYKISQLDVKNQLHRITSKAHDILHVIEEDPKDLRRARKFLNVYLDGTQNVINGYVDIQNKQKAHQSPKNEKLETSFENVLDTVEQVFTEQHQKLLENDVLDLDIQIEVLQTQLKHEGVV